MALVLPHTSRPSFLRAATARLVAGVRRWWRWRIERWELLAMDDRELRDIGLTRLDARYLSRKPDWRW